MRPSVATLLDFDDFDAPARLDAPEPPPEPEVIAPSQSADTLDAVRTQAFEDGYHHGVASAATTQAAELAATCRAIAERLAEAGTQAAQSAEACAEAMLKLIVELIAAGYPSLRERYGEQEIHRLIRLVAPALTREASIVVQVAPGLAEPVAQHLAGMIADSDGRLSVAPLAALAPGDARIQWKDGSAVRDSTGIWPAIAAILGPLGLMPDTEPAARAADPSANHGQ